MVAKKGGASKQSAASKPGPLSSILTLLRRLHVESACENVSECVCVSVCGCVREEEDIMVYMYCPFVCVC